MSKALVVVESPAKARTIAKFLGRDYVVEPSVGHVRDLPSNAAEIPASLRKKAWARLGVDVEDGFKPLYVIPARKRAQVKKLKDLLKKADTLYLATDEDREGEAIAWHLVEVLAPRVPIKRLAFHEITATAIEQALRQPRAIDQRLVDAQEARRILDRLVGYELSPVLWRKVRPKLSAGRVQSVATRLIVERERARMAFRLARYWGLTAQLSTADAASFEAELLELDGQRVATGKDFDPANGALTSEAASRRTLLLDEAAARGLAHALTGAPATVVSLAKKPFTQRPAPPFITSTLQQEAGRKLRFSAQRTMRVAQGLYENGYITYMRTDSTNLSAEALGASRRQIGELFGARYLPEVARHYTKKVKGAQEAHEAIRPAGDAFRTPEQVRGELDDDAARLYELIWKRTLASQMPDALGERTVVLAAVALPAPDRLDAARQARFQRATLQATGKVISFPGFLRVYVEDRDEAEAEVEAERGDHERTLPALAEGQGLTVARAEASEHQTKPPARFTEASLVKELEQRGIGRPSTYASIIQTILDRGYVFKRGGALVPTLTAFAVTALLEQYFSELVDYAFTARMEDDLDAISCGERQATPWLQRFYFGAGESGGASRLEALGLKGQIGASGEDIDPRRICSLPLGRTADGQVVEARVGRWGPYLQAGEARRANLPDDLPPDELTLDAALRLLEQADVAQQPLGVHPASGLPVYVRSGRFGPYVQLGDAPADRKEPRPKMASLWPGMSPQTLTLAQALELLAYPRLVGVHPEHGAEIWAQDGQYGPYLSMTVDGKRDARSLTDHEQLRTIDLAGALALFAQPRQRRNGAAARTVIAELGTSSVTGKPLQVKTGRFGPYVTDGQVNATIPRGRDPASLGLEEALALLQAREEKLRGQGVDPRAAKPARQSRRRPRRAAAQE